MGGSTVLHWQRFVQWGEGKLPLHRTQLSPPPLPKKRRKKKRGKGKEREKEGEDVLHVFTSSLKTMQPKKMLSAMDGRT